MLLPEDLQDLLVADDAGVVFQLQGLCVAIPAADAPVGGVGGVPAGVTDASRDNSPKLREASLGVPESSKSKNCNLSCLRGNGGWDIGLCTHIGTGLARGTRLNWRND